MDNSIVVHERSMSPLIEQAETLEIKTQEHLVVATELLSSMNKVMDAITAEKEKVTRPLLDALAAERGRWKPIETRFKEAIDPLRQKISKYQTELIRQQDKIAKQTASGKLSIEAATALVPSDKIETAMGSLTFREKAELRITDKKKVPEKYWIIDEDKLLADLKAGKLVPGAVVNFIQVPLNKRS